MELPSNNYLDWFRRHGKAPPTHLPHGTDEDVRDNLKPVKINKWRMEGPGHLVADTEIGTLVQRVGTDMICLGTDKNGMPILKKIEM